MHINYCIGLNILRNLCIAFLKKNDLLKRTFYDDILMRFLGFIDQIIK